jgi:alkanesulfonate monooxygenase SsuD/methylene tetrahydromethanopterin reductase-like flavin-dependent oxidoreductase (luciferase family)
MLEAYTTLGFLAAQTERVRLGTMVTGVTFRPPALLVKAVTTLDVLSGGRAWLGIGAGYHGEEAGAMGLPLPPVAERFQRLEETRHCERVGRPYDQIEKTLSTRLQAGEPAAAFVTRSRAAAALGIQHLVVLTPGPWTADLLAVLAAAIPTLRERPVAAAPEIADTQR